MDIVERMVDLLREKWGAKTLAMLRDEATREFNGTLFDAVRAQNASRFMLVICLTGQHEIKTLKTALRLDKTGKPADWDTTTVYDVVVRTMRGSGLSYEAQYDSKGREISVLLIITEPRSVHAMEQLFKMQP